MRFYALEKYPEGDAETCALTGKSFVKGDAPSCPTCGATVGSLTWLPPLRGELELFGREFGDLVFPPGSNDFLVSQKFKDVYYGHCLTGLSGFDPVDVIKVKCRRKMPSGPP